MAIILADFMLIFSALLKTLSWTLLKLNLPYSVGPLCGCIIKNVAAKFANHHLLQLITDPSEYGTILW